MLQNDRVLEMRSRPYATELILQNHLSEHPLLIPGDQISPDNPRRWVLVKQEAGIADTSEGSDRWSVDHLLLDQDAIPTFVEVKRKSDTRLRREVVAQMLDYAANATEFFSVEKIQVWFESQHSNYEEKLNDLLLGDPESILGFWAKVRDNLQLGKIRLIFLADEIPVELQRIIEFLKSQFKETLVCAVELKQYLAETGGQETKIFVPRVLGSNESVTEKRATNSLIKSDEEFTSKITLPIIGQIWNNIRSLALDHHCDFIFGSASCGIRHSNGIEFFRVYPFGSRLEIGVPFSEISKRAPFDQNPEELRIMIKTLSCTNGKSDFKTANLSMSELGDQQNWGRFTAVFEWLVRKINES